MDKNEVLIPKPLSDLIESCETICVSSCCDIDAFDINPETVKRWANQVGSEKLAQAKDQLRLLKPEVEKPIGSIRVRTAGGLLLLQPMADWLDEWEAAMNAVGD